MSAPDVVANLKELARLTSTADGAQRLAWGPVWRDARTWFNGKLAQLGITPEIDAAGNSWATMKGASEKTIIIGGHLDSVPNGGWLDGALGVMAGLEALRMFKGQRPPVTLKVVDWADEEGARFGRSLLGSSAAAGSLQTSDVEHLVDKTGVTLVDALRENGVELARMHDALQHLKSIDAKAYLELHIEQGPVLESQNLPAGVVGGIVGITWSEVTVTGQSDHAGPSPMHLRHDALTASAEIILGVEQIAKRRDETAVATIGRIAAQPNVINTIPGQVVFSVDFRHSDPAILEGQVERLRELVDDVASRRGVEVTVERFWTSEPTPFDARVQNAIRTSATALGIPTGELWSGAGHDAKYLAEVCPSGMIFVRSQGGLSHCEAEFSTPADIEAGANLLLNAAINLAG